MKQTKAVIMVLKVVATSHQEMADTCDLNLTSICRGVFIQILKYKKRESFSLGDEEVVVVGAEREKDSKFYWEHIAERFDIGLLLHQVMSEYQSVNIPLWNLSQWHSVLPREWVAGASLCSGSKLMHHDSHHKTHALP